MVRQTKYVICVSSGEILACDQSSFVAIKPLRERELLKNFAGSYVFANEGVFMELPAEWKGKDWVLFLCVACLAATDKVMTKRQKD